MLFFQPYLYIEKGMIVKMNRNNKNDKFVIKKNKNTNRRIIIRTTDEMADEIFEIARQNEVSVNTLLVNCIRYALDHRE